VGILADLLVEGDESFRLVLSDPTNAVLGVSQGTATIRDDDVPPSGVEVAFTKRDDWGAGFVADMTITNNQTTAIDGWTLEFDFEYEITSIWNAVIVSHVGNQYVIRNAPWNGSIAPGAAVTFGFQGTPGNVQGPTNLVLNGTPVPS
jgi:chitinase